MNLELQKEITMGKLEKDKIKYTPLKKISNPLGDIWHALKSSEEEFTDFGELLFFQLYLL